MTDILSSSTAANRQQQQPWTTSLVRQKLEAVRTRPTTLAAHAFFEDPACPGSFDETGELTYGLVLGERICQLVETMEAWDDISELGEAASLLSFSPTEDDNMDTTETNDEAAKRLAVTAAIRARAPDNFEESAQYMFQTLLSGTHIGEDQDDDNVEERISRLLGEGRTQDALFTCLQKLGWMKPHTAGGLMHAALLKALGHTVRQKVKSTIAGDFETPGLYAQLLEWKDSCLVPWLQSLLGPSNYQAEQWSERLVTIVAECYCRFRMEEEMFFLVADYPDSLPAVEELRTVLHESVPHLVALLGQTLRASVVRRLNHPGATTSQIIDVYIATIKVLGILDPSDRLLSVVAEPVRSYLRGRHDTVRCIISSLTDADGSNSAGGGAAGGGGGGGDYLYEELRRQDARPLENVTVDSDDEEEPPDMNWQPQPSLRRSQQGGLSLLTTSSARHRKSSGGDRSDILAMLVSIYGSKELFVNEYRLMLADKLLANLDYNTDKEVHTLELLKLRFGEQSMRNCEVMIKDMEDSKRANQNIQSTLKEKTRYRLPPYHHESVVDAVMVSHIFWPTLQNDELKHHPRLQYQLDEFSNEYARLKNPRRLIWMNQLGTVQLTLDVMERKGREVVTEKRDFSVSPVLATLILHFENKTEWTPEDLSNETGLSELVIRKRMAFWVNQRVVVVASSSSSSTGLVYQLATTRHLASATRDMDSTSVMEDDDGSESQAVSANAQKQEEMEVYESYIVGMLTNLQQLPLDRIHNMLKMFAAGSDHKYNKTPQQLSAFLQHLCRQEKLEVGPDGYYKLFSK